MVNQPFTGRTEPGETHGYQAQVATIGLGDLAMRGIGVTVVGALLCLAAPGQADVQVTVSKSQQRLAVVVDGNEIARWPVSTGVRGHETPTGVFRPHDIERHWYSRQYSLTPMPWAVFFHRGYAVHATMESYNLGHPASHGCVRLRPDNASILFNLVRRQGLNHTKVTVQNGPLPPPPGAQPMAEADTPVELRQASMVSVDYAARAHAEVTPDDEIAPPRARNGDFVVHRVSVSSDERQILREREAWLRSLDRKYGITR